LTWNEATNKCEVCSDSMESVSPVNEINNNGIRNIIGAMVFVIGISLM